MSVQEKEFTIEEVEKHNQVDDLWVVYNGAVYDITKYVDEHPGGEEVVVDVAGTDATEPFDDIGHSDDAHEILASLKIGNLKGGVVKKVTTAQSKTSGDSGVNVPLIAVVVLLIAVVGYYFLNQ